MPFNLQSGWGFHFGLHHFQLLFVRFLRFPKYSFFTRLSPPRVLILGHSFVRRLSSFLSHSNTYSDNLGLQDVAEIALFGVGRRMITKVEKLNLGFVCEWKPDIVILELGTNDLTKFSADSVGSSLEELVQLLYENCSVKVNGVCQIIKCCPPPSKMLDFNS